MIKTALASLDDLRALGVSVTVCPPRKAKGIYKQKMRARLAGLYRVGGEKPAAVKAAMLEAA